jgi:hypothetical protein
MAKRYPIYAEADVIIDSSTGPHAVSVKAVADALLQRQNSIAAAAKA